MQPTELIQQNFHRLQTLAKFHKTFFSHSNHLFLKQKYVRAERDSREMKLHETEFQRHDATFKWAKKVQEFHLKANCFSTSNDDSQLQYPLQLFQWKHWEDLLMIILQQSGLSKPLFGFHGNCHHWVMPSFAFIFIYCSGKSSAN